MFRSGVHPDEGLLFIQTSENRLDAAIHMFFVPFDLGVIWLDHNKHVVDLCLAKPWRPFYMPAKPARYILETHPTRLDHFQIGDLISFEHA